MDVLIDDLYFEMFRGDGMIILMFIGSIVYNKFVVGVVVDLLFLCMQVFEFVFFNNNNYWIFGLLFVFSFD